MKKKLFRYFLICIASYLLLAFIEIFLLRPLVDMITMNFWGRFAIYCVLLLLIDPLIMRYIANHFDLNEKTIDEEDA